MKFNQKSILVSVFISGACSLIIEVTGFRILSSYFGNTIYTSSSVISVVLAALSFGYYYGGKFADKHAKESNLYLIIFLSGLGILAVDCFRILLLPTVFGNLSYISGPLISAIVLFSVPSFLLGTLSPLAITLIKESDKKEGVGEISGKVFFYSTFGSIVGSLLTGFYLIPSYGIHKIILYSGLLLGLVGFVGATNSGLKKKLTKSLFLLSIFIITVLDISLFDNISKTNIVYSKEGIYGKISFVDSSMGGKKARFFIHDTNTSSGIYLDDGELIFDYTKYYKLYKVFSYEPKDALVIGGGAYTIPNALVNESDDIKVDVLEIEPELYTLSKKYFDIQENPRMSVTIEDGRKYLTDSGKKYDYIFSDVYLSFASIPEQFTTKEFFRLANDSLNDDGIIIINLIGQLSRTTPNYLLSEIKTFESVFHNSYIIATKSPYSIYPQNFIFVGVKNENKLSTTELTNLNFDDSVIDNLNEKIVDPNLFNLDNQVLLTDDYAPIENLIGKVIKNLNLDESKVNGDEAIGLVDQITSYGPRTINSDGHRKTKDFIVGEMNLIADSVDTQIWQEEGNEFTNIIARLNPESKNRIILSTNYDSKKIPNRERYLNRNSSSLAANDSASGPALLIDLARILKQDNHDVGYDLIFFDGEEGLSDYKNVEWYPIGSHHFMLNIDNYYAEDWPKIAIYFRDVCGKDLHIDPENYSYNDARDEISEYWAIGQEKYPDVFGNEVKYTVSSAQNYFVSYGVKSFTVLDFEYPYYLRLGDTVDKCSAKSFEKVGDVTLTYLHSIESKN